MYSKTIFQNIGKLFSKYELLFLHQANSEFDNHVLYMLAWVAWANLGYVTDMLAWATWQRG